MLLMFFSDAGVKNMLKEGGLVPFPHCGQRIRKKTNSRRLEIWFVVEKDVLLFIPQIELGLFLKLILI